MRVRADTHALVIGIVYLDRDPSRIVSFTKQRDAPLHSEDNVTIVLDTFMDGRSGYVFQVNPSGARTTRSSIRDAAPHRDDRGWSVEIWIPLNDHRIQGRTHALALQRAAQDPAPPGNGTLVRGTPGLSITQISRAGLLADLPEFSVGMGLTARPAVPAHCEQRQ